MYSVVLHIFELLNFSYNNLFLQSGTPPPLADSIAPQMGIYWTLLLYAMALVAMVTPQRITQQTCDRRQRFATVRGDADVLLAGVFPIRTSGQDEYGCGDVGTGICKLCNRHGDSKHGYP